MCWSVRRHVEFEKNPEGDTIDDGKPREGLQQGGYVDSVTGVVKDSKRFNLPRIFSKRPDIPVVGRLSRYFVDAILTVLRVISAESPPTTKAK